MEEIRWYFGIVICSISVISINIYRLYGNVADTVRHASFQVASIMTTTGYATTDFNLWPTTSKFVLVILMVIGACAGSTGGGIKVSRIAIMVKTIRKEINTYIHPKSVKKILFDEKLVEHEVLRAINVYLITYIIIYVLSVFVISFEGYDLTTTLTSVLATFNNIGPGLELVGPTSNFGFLNSLSKTVLMIDMLAGRLELFPLLILFHPKVLRDLLFGFVKKN